VFIRLGAREPEFDTPTHQIGLPSRRSATAKASKYTAVDRIPEFEGPCGRGASSKRENELNLQASQIIIAPGASRCLFNALLAETLMPATK